MADKLEFSEKLVYDYFKQHKLHKSGADAVIQMVQMPLYRWCSLHEAKKQSLQRL